MDALQVCGNPGVVRFGFIHGEPKGILALDQKGWSDPKTGKSAGNLKQTRLYIYPFKDSDTVFLITLGDKKTQPNDIKASVIFVNAINEEASHD